MLISACTIIGVFATFIQIQNQLLLPVPWYVFLSRIFLAPAKVSFTQVLPVLHHRLRTRRLVHHPPPLAHLPAPTAPVDCHDWRVHTVCAVARGVDCHLGAVVGSHGFGQLQL